MFEGSMVALVTPMKADGAIDWNALEALIEFHLDNATDAIVAVGTTGESATLDNQEHCAVIHYVVERVARQVPVIAGTGANSTREAIELTRFAYEAGADAALLVTPYYNKPTQEGLYQHYKAVAEAVPIAQILYNVPGRTACDMLPETVARLAEIDNIVGLKEATDVQRAREVIDRCEGQLEVYSGDDANALEIILQGGRGVISVTANVAPKPMHDMCVAALNGDRETAAAINRQLSSLHRDLFVESNPIPVKWALHEIGLIPQGIRLPLTPLSAQYHQRLRDSMRQAGVWSP
ncbi:MAG TPA: 4-hydroxy-tetrahydrodipicolinate synthase [Gammaproteobacteria bacterium]|nr:4-hydroxy-tetrahydrodipicolinate synthase [Gammaproteobacteria bacterium]